MRSAFSPPPVVDQPRVGDGKDEGPETCVTAPDAGQFWQDVHEHVLGQGLGVVHAPDPEVAQNGRRNDPVHRTEPRGVTS